MPGSSSQVRHVIRSSRRMSCRRGRRSAQRSVVTQPYRGSRSRSVPRTLVPSIAARSSRLLPANQRSNQEVDMSATSMTARIRVLAVDDHPLLREGIAALIANQPDMQLVGEAASGVEAVEKFRATQPNVPLMDLQMPEMSGIDAIIAIRGE